MKIKFKSMKTTGRYKIIAEWEGTYFRKILKEEIPIVFIDKIKEDLNKLGINEIKINMGKSIIWNKTTYAKTQIYFKNKEDESLFLFRYCDGMNL
jgi:hypothetical protein